MARLEKQNNRIVITLNDAEAAQLQTENAEFELFSPKKGLLLLTEKTEFAADVQTQPKIQTDTATPVTDSKTLDSNLATDEKLFKILSDRKQLSQRIVGKFEKTLSKTELDRFNELFKQGLIEKFKLNEQYKQPVYRLNEKKLAEKKTVLVSNPKPASAQSNSWSVPPNSKSTVPSNANNPNNSTNSLSLERDGFLILKTENDARILSNLRADDFKKGALRGIKTFDGSFFVIKKDTFENAQTKILSVFEQTKTASLENLARQTQLRLELLRGACEFLKEDGFLFEKTKQTYCLV